MELGQKKSTSPSSQQTLFSFSNKSKLPSSIDPALASCYPPEILLVTSLHHRPLSCSVFGSSWTWRWKKLLWTTSKSWRSKSGSFWWSWFWTPCNKLSSNAAGMFSYAWVKFSELELQVKPTAFSLNPSKGEYLGFYHCQKHMLLGLPVPPLADTCKQWLLYVHQAFTQACDLHNDPCGLLRHHRAVRMTVACSLLFGKLFDSIIFFSLFYLCWYLLS